MIFRNRKKSKGNFLYGRRIGVLGLGPRVGTTHISIAIANTLSEYGKMKVLLLEENRHDDIGALTLSLGAKGKDTPFPFHRVTYIPRAPFQERGELKDMDYDCMVSDLGSDFKSGLSRIMLYDIKILVGTEGAWRSSEFDKLENITSGSEVLGSWRLFINLGNPKKLKEKDGLGFTTCCFPFEPDPVYPGDDTIKFIREAIYG